MPVLLANRQRAALVIFVLGLALVIALMPYLSGLIGGLVLCVLFAPIHAHVTRHVAPRISAALMVLLALLLLIVPALSLAGILVEQAQGIAAGMVTGPLLERLSALEIGGVQIGPRLAGFGEQILGWIGSSAIGLVGHATRLGLNLTISLFILYFLLLRQRETWEAVRPYIPFRPASADQLRDRFRDVTLSTLIGTGAIALVQGLFVGIGFLLAGLHNAMFWGVVTMVVAILPVVGAGLVWGPGVVSLFLDGRYGAAVGLGLLGVVVVANVDVVIRPAVFRRFAQVHPLVTLIGAIGGISYLGLLGILIGPLAISYFFELIRMYREEYLLAPPVAVPAEAEPGPGAT